MVVSSWQTYLRKAPTCITEQGHPNEAGVAPGRHVFEIVTAAGNPHGRLWLVSLARHLAPLLCIYESFAKPGS